MKSSCPALVTALAFILVMALTLIIFGKKNETVRLTKDAEYAEQVIAAHALKIKEEQYVLDLLEKDMKAIEINVDKEGKTLKDMTGENQKKATEKEACQKLQVRECLTTVELNFPFFKEFMCITVRCLRRC